VNDFYQKGDVTRDELHTLLVLMNPVCPHITEEMNEMIGFTTPIYESEWPKHDEAALVKDEMEIAVQINGKVRAKMMIPVGMEEAALRELVLANDEVKPHVDGKNIVKFIAIRNIVNIVVK
jgi:leucyl-tRNA synthetase